MAEHAPPRVEMRDVSPRVLWLFGLGFAAFVALSAAGLLLVFPPGAPWTFHRAAPPGPVLQVAPAADLRELLARKRAELLDRGWIDEGAGIAEIPIEQAMRLVAQGHRAAAGPAARRAEPAPSPRTLR